MEMLQGFFVGTSEEELVTPYVRECMRANEPVTVHGFFAWIDRVKNSNIKFMIDAVFNYLLALQMFRAGIRRNNSDVMMAGRTRFSSLFYVLHYPKYRQIEYRDLKDRYLMEKYAPELYRYIMNTDAFTQHGDLSTGEAGDFINEEINKERKNLLPSKNPSDNDWLVVERSLDKVKQLHKKTTELCELERKDQRKAFDSTNIASGWRKELRKQGVLKPSL